jgi:hypothetical protein
VCLTARGRAFKGLGEVALEKKMFIGLSPKVTKRARYILNARVMAGEWIVSVGMVFQINFQMKSFNL